MRVLAQKDGELNDADQQALAALLAKAGYTVRRSKVRKNENSSARTRAVDFWGDGERVT